MPDPHPSAPSLFKYVALGALLLNLLFFALAWDKSRSSLEGHVTEAQMGVENLALVLERDIANSFDKLNTALLVLAESYSRHISGQGLDAATWNAELIAQRKRHPLLNGLRATDAAGNVIHGLEPGSASGANIGDRDYFIHLRDHAEAGLVITKPIFGRTSHAWVIALARRLNDRNGAFAGVMYAIVPLDYFLKRFHELKLDKNASVSLRDRDLGLVVRHPGLKAGQEIGQTSSSDEFHVALTVNPVAGIYTSAGDARKGDGISRLHAYRRNADYGFLINVGFAREDFLADWRQEVMRTIVLACLFALLSFILVWQLRRAWRMQQAALLELQRSEQRFHSLFDHMTEGQALHELTYGPDGKAANYRILDVNPAYETHTGLARNQVIGKLATDAYATASPPYLDIYAEVVATGRPAAFEGYAPQTGRYFRVLAYVPQAGQVACVFEDITARREAEGKVRHLAHHDSLTGLANRMSLYDRLSLAIGFCRRNNSRLAVMLLDLDRFKAINDTLGHHVGDQLLVDVARRLNESVRDSDIVARLGGDEFVIVLTDLQGPDDAAHVAEKIVKTISAPFSTNGSELHTSPSIGICMFPDDAERADDLLRHADVAMYHAKAEGRCNFQFFTSELQAATQARLLLESELRTALEYDQFILYYQPQLDLRSGRIASVEALIRWRHPQRGLLSPQEFIPVAEETGFIVPLGDWVLQEASRQVAAWRSGGLSDFKVSVNLSARQFLDPDLPSRIQQLLDEHDLPPDSLDLEVTESMSMAAPDKTIAVMRLLAGNGLSLSIDDFGTGYSSLAYLKLFPIHILKIDRSFVKDIETDPNDAEICDVTVLLAHKLGLEVVAEGVESETQLRYLLSIGCEKVQGYLISRPITAAEIEPFVRGKPPLASIGTIDLWLGH